MRCALLLLFLPGMAATDNAICAVMSPLMVGLDSAPGMSCSCIGDGTNLNIGGDSKCVIEIGPPPVDALNDLKFKIDLGTTVRPCDMPAKAELAGGIYLPQLSQARSCPSGASCQTSCLAGSCTSPDETLDAAVSTAIQALAADVEADIAYAESDNKISISLSAEAGKSVDLKLPVYKTGADIFIKLSLTLEGNAAALKTTQVVDLCMKPPGVDEICGADIPKCDGTYSAGALGAAQQVICTVANINWNELFGSPPIQMTPSQEMSFTDACATASSSGSSGSSGSSSSNPDDSGVIAGAVIGVILFLGTIICVSVAILVNQGKMRNPLERLKEKLGKRQVHVAEMTPAK